MHNSSGPEHSGDSRRVAYQGTSGAYSHLACRRVFPDWEAVACDDFLSALELVANGFAERAMIPLENSTAGRVEEIYRLIPRTSLFVTAEHFEPINHCLLALPGASLANIERVASHPQALAQCHQRITNLGMKAVAAMDTAMEAEALSLSGDRSRAAIASELAAELYGLEILHENFQDVMGNTTRFLVFSREAEHQEYQQGVNYVTSLMFSVRNIPAALYKALGGFATNGVNLLKLESYMDGGTMKVSHFHMDIQGHPQQHNMLLALEELDYFAGDVRILGSYPAHDYRA
ncbi:MAG: prephenate dehydratase [Oceanospirillaceae bacterium]|nr:prephenate dehydratase [Oceanospirillaceae bacterium]MBT12581.1 prephenate dehydratase [Oceanospirillaceae bacterium]|tara:strand:+ start:12431 stop:13300 length:870 start_codon:yes stop_codon:yes gene_type:complete